MGEGRKDAYRIPSFICKYYAIGIYGNSRTEKENWTGTCFYVLRALSFYILSGGNRGRCGKGDLQRMHKIDQEKFAFYDHEHAAFDAAEELLRMLPGIFDFKNI